MAHLDWLCGLPAPLLLQVGQAVVSVLHGDLGNKADCDKITRIW